MKHWLKPIGIFVAIVGFLGTLALVAGIVPIQASSGHWPITRWLLNFAKERSVATYSRGIKAPDLSDPELVLLGAGAYHTSCFICHGSPEFPERVVPAAMTPDPPYLPSRLSEYTDEELFFIVKHGLKFTGMPAWPALKRDEEIWSVIAFLKRLPEMDAPSYRELVWGDARENAAAAPRSLVAAVPPETIAQCFRCHSSDGLGRGDKLFPKLSGQSREYLRNSLSAYADGERGSGVMQPVASRLRENEIDALASYFAALPRPPAVDATDPQARNRGREIALNGVPQRRIPSCVDCHDPAGVERKPTYPILYGQPADYLLRQLQLFKAGHRGGSRYAHLMQPVVERLTEKEMRDVAVYFESQSSSEIQKADTTSESP